MLTQHDPVMADLRRYLVDCEEADRPIDYVQHRAPEIVRDVILGATDDFDLAIGDSCLDEPHCSAMARHEQRIAQCVLTGDDVSLARVAREYGEFLVSRINAHAEKLAEAEYKKLQEEVLA